MAGEYNVVVGVENRMQEAKKILEELSNLSSLSAEDAAKKLEEISNQAQGVVEALLKSADRLQAARNTFERRSPGDDHAVAMAPKVIAHAREVASKIEDAINKAKEGSKKDTPTAKESGDDQTPEQGQGPAQE